MRSVDYNKFKDEGPIERVTGAPGEIAELLLHMGSSRRCPGEHEHPVLFPPDAR